jgi:hypothetical protein
MQQWDIYITTSEIGKGHSLTKDRINDPIIFKLANEKSYTLYREIMQLIDISMLDSMTLQFQPRTIVAACFYFVIGLHFQAINIQPLFDVDQWTF